MFFRTDREREKELEMIKQQYLGQDKKKKKIQKASDKFRFNFDWEATEDTSKDLNPLYNNTHGRQGRPEEGRMIHLVGGQGGCMKGKS